jgi:hypothetical protein
MTHSSDFAHVVNPVAVTPDSDLFVAQPVTFGSMRAAKEMAKGRCTVELVTAQFPEDRLLTPADFRVTPDLERSVLNVGRFSEPRKLPLLADILNRLYAVSDAEYFIYSNVDIALMPHFYVTLKHFVDSGIDACIINRRTIPAGYSRVDELPLMYAEIGNSHPGYDCFVFKRTALPSFDLGTVCIGAVRVGFVLAANLICFSERFREFPALHLTFHIGNERRWRNPQLQDYADHNTREAAAICERLAPQFKRHNLPDVTMPALRELVARLRARHEP